MYVSFCTNTVEKAQKMPWEKVGDRRLANRKATIVLIAFALLPHIVGLAALTIHVMSNRMHHYVPHAGNNGNSHSHNPHPLFISIFVLSKIATKHYLSPIESDCFKAYRPDLTHIFAIVNMILNNDS